MNAQTFKDAWLSYGRPALIVAAITVTFAGGYATGRRPARVTERLVEDTAARERVYQLEAQLATMKRDSRRETVRVVRVDGSSETRTVVDTHVERAVDARRETEARREVATHTAAERTVTAARPDWRVGPMVGFDFRSGTVAYGGQVERRILGPVSVGAFGLSSGVAGVSLSLEF